MSEERNDHMCGETNDRIPGQGIKTCILPAGHEGLPHLAEDGWRWFITEDEIELRRQLSDALRERDEARNNPNCICIQREALLESALREIEDLKAVIRGEKKL